MLEKLKLRACAGFSKISKLHASTRAMRARAEKPACCDFTRVAEQQLGKKPKFWLVIISAEVLFFGYYFLTGLFWARPLRPIARETVLSSGKALLFRPHLA